MAFMETIRKIETIKEENGFKFAKQEVLMKEPISNMSKVVVDSDSINDTFASLVSEQLSKSDFKLFSKVLLDNEIQYISDAVGHGDILSFIYGKDKQINEIVYQNSDKSTLIKIKVRKDKAIVRSITNNIDGSILEKKYSFKKDEDEYYQTTLLKKATVKEDDLTSVYTEKLSYVKETDELVKKLSIITYENEIELSNTTVNSVIDRDDFTIDEGKFYLIDKKKEQGKIKKVKSLENKLVKVIN